jgi:hypothetical protein
MADDVFATAVSQITLGDAPDSEKKSEKRSPCICHHTLKKNQGKTPDWSLINQAIQ